MRHLVVTGLLLVAASAALAEPRPATGPAGAATGEAAIAPPAGATGTGADRGSTVGGALSAAGLATPAAAAPDASSAAVPSAALAPPPPVPSQALIEKLGAGDRAYLAGDYRGALFLYQDAAYLDPGSTAARIRLARAYAGLRYPDKAEAQLQQVLAQEPDDAEARKLLEELRSAPARPGTPGGASPVAPVAAGARVYKFNPEASPSPVAAPPSYRPGQVEVSPPPPPNLPTPEDGPSAADLYRAGVAQVARREFALAVGSFDRALTRDPGLVIAFEGRASARFGLGQYREAARDYQSAHDAGSGRASPLWGLAECFRLLGDPRAGETYARYAESGAPDVVEAQRDTARLRAIELRGR